MVPIPEEIASCDSQTAEGLKQLRANGVVIDGDAALVEKLRTLVTRIGKVSHTPDYPWEVHLIHQPINNAYTIGGGKLFVYTGVIGGSGFVQTDLELAGVIAHEVAHVACRHIPKTQTWATYGPLISKRIAGGMYKATYTNEQEDEADRVGVLYMALAGFDPRAVAPMWVRAHQTSGSDPGTYRYDHSLNIDRARNTEAAAALAIKYYVGSNVINDQAGKILLKNDLIQREAAPANESEFEALVTATANSYLEHLKVRQEESAREKAAQQKRAEEDKAALQQAFALRGLREYRCFRCSKTMWAKPGSRGTCPHCKTLLAIPK